MKETTQYYTGELVMYRGEMAAIVSVGIYDRATDSEHFSYTIELSSGKNIIDRVREEELRHYQERLL